MRANFEKIDRKHRITMLKDEAIKLTHKAMHQRREELRRKEISDYIQLHTDAVYKLIRFWKSTTDECHCQICV